jgi:hypothetical protein
MLDKIVNTVHKVLNKITKKKEYKSSLNIFLKELKNANIPKNKYNKIIQKKTIKKFFSKVDKKRLEDYNKALSIIKSNDFAEKLKDDFTPEDYISTMYISLVKRYLKKK